MNDHEEQIYTQGCHSVYREMLGIALRGLGGNDDMDAARAVLQLHDARQAMRGLLEEHDMLELWDDRLALESIIKRLERNI